MAKTFHAYQVEMSKEGFIRHIGGRNPSANKIINKLNSGKVFLNVFLMEKLELTLS